MTAPPTLRPPDVVAPPGETPAADPEVAEAERAGGGAGSGAGGGALLGAVLALVVAACLPLARVYVDLSFLPPVLAAALLPVGLGWASRRLGGGPLAALLASAVGWAVFVGAAFVSHTVVLGIVPTADTAAAVGELWRQAVQLVRTRPAPVFAEPALLLLTTTGVWWVAHAVEGLVFRLQAPLRAVVMALVLWSVPLAMAPGGPSWPWAVPLLAASAWLLASSAPAELERLASRLPRGAPARGDRLPAWVVATVAIAAGAMLGGMLPGFAEPPLYELRRFGGTTVATNPIVNIRASLVSQSSAPVVRVTSPRPVYLRLTGLDVYSEREEWTSDGIRGRALSGRPLPPEVMPANAREVTVDVTVEDLDRAILVPVPYQPIWISGEPAESFQYDRDGATVTLASGAALEPGDAYAVTALLPEPPPELLAGAATDGADPRLTALPPGVPAEVGELARRIVDAAGATTPFEQAMALQVELRGWEYSLDPPQGHGSSAMLSFIDNRVGYCEQYAGTMAVMLRTLGIPARVAVGFTPGDPEATVDDPDSGEPVATEYVVTHANAHAWVEVLFPGVGWIAFEPTPRSDGNVLVPTGTDPVPNRTDAERSAGRPDDEPPAIDDPQMLDLPTRAPTPPDGSEAAAAGGADGPAGGFGLLLVGLGVLAALSIGAVSLLGVSRRRAAGGPAATRVLAAVDGVRRLGHGLGYRSHPSETDLEYLQRLPDASDAGRRLADAAARARYAPSLPDGVAQAAERAAAELSTSLLAGRRAPGRAAVRLRARAWLLGAGGRARARRLAATVAARAGALADAAGGRGRRGG